MSHYEPPCTISPKIVGLVEKIGEALGRITERGDSKSALRLRRLDRVRTIHGSLAIEGNELSADQVTALMEGKRVVAAASDILEAKNAIRVYDRFDEWNPTSESDLLAAHEILLDGLAEDAGSYRSGGVGVVSGKDVVHVAPPAGRVPQLMGDLFSWIEKTEQHPLIASSIFHYEFEFIHPFSDGNGRMGRLWQSLLLSAWNPLFANLPVESVIHANQDNYYRAIHQSTNGANSCPFVEFLLSVLLETLTGTPQATPQATPQVTQLLEALGNDELSRADLQEKLSLRDRKSFRERYLSPALEGGWIEPTNPDKPNSPNQKYRAKPHGVSPSKTS